MNDNEPKVTYRDIMIHVVHEFDRFLENMLIYSEDNNISHEQMAKVLNVCGVDADFYYEAVEDWSS